ncbi:MAG: YciI family protein [Anaerolineae bacterium]|nr:YciI family protein [Anaerolineae bacterium]
MKYIALIYGEDITQTPEEIKAEIGEYYAYETGLGARGVQYSGHALHPVSTATTVRVRDGKTLTTDGPFAETKEILGGLYVFDCNDLDEAIELASQIPGAKRGSIEVRPIMTFE